MHRTPHDFPERNGRFDLSKIDLRQLSPEQWVELKTQIACRARSDRNRAIGIAIGGALGWLWRTLRRLLKWRQLRAAWISHVRKRREQIAAAQLRGLSDQWLGDMGLTRGEIESRVRYCARPSPWTR
jgi:hypothetical protein